jgi:hypothetical protein
LKSSELLSHVTVLGIRGGTARRGDRALQKELQNCKPCLREHVPAPHLTGTETGPREGQWVTQSLESGLWEAKLLAWVELVPSKDVLKNLTPVTQNVTLFGNRVSLQMQLLKTRSH